MDVFNQLTLDLGMPFTSTELVFGVLACILAIWLGARLAKKQAHAFSGQAHDSGLPAVTFADYGDMRFLHLGTPAVQGSMKLSKPFDIHLDYLQRMMGWLLFVDLDQVSHLHAMQMGLGAASLTKFCHHHLDMRTTAIELNPNVVTTCRRWFNLPKDNAKLQVLLGDAAEVASQDTWRGKVDVLQVDLYDQEAARPMVDSDVFYANCRALLTPNGCMVVNFFGHDSNFEESMQKIANSFGTDALWAFKPTTAGNTVVLAFGTPRTVSKDALLIQAQKIQTRWPLPATKWLKVFAPIKKKPRSP